MTPPAGQGAQIPPRPKAPGGARGRRSWFAPLGCPVRRVRPPGSQQLVFGCCHAISGAQPPTQQRNGLFPRKARRARRGMRPQPGIDRVLRQVGDALPAELPVKGARVQTGLAQALLEKLLEVQLKRCPSWPVSGVILLASRARLLRARKPDRRRRRQCRAHLGRSPLLRCIRRTSGCSSGNSATTIRPRPKRLGDQWWSSS